MSKEEWLIANIILYSELVDIMDNCPSLDGANHRKEYREFIDKCKQELSEKIA